MKYFPVLISALIFTFFLSCKSGNSDGNTSDQLLSIDTFSTFPPEIEGCACYFSNNETDFKNDLYIYMNDHAQLSFLTINGVLTKFIQTEYKKIDSLNTVEKFRSDDYEITIHTIYGEQNGDETSLYSGTIELTDKKGKTIKKSFYGECGC